MVNLPEDKNYFNWVQQLSTDGVLSQLMLDYYSDSDAVLSVKINDTEYTYPIGTHPTLLHPHFTLEGIEYNSDIDKFIEHDDELIERTIKQIQNNRTDAPELPEDTENILWNDNSYVVSSSNFDTSHKSSALFELSDSDFYTTLTQDQKLTTELISEILDDHLVGSTTIVKSDVFSQPLELRERYFSSILDRLSNSGEYKQGIGGTYVTLIKSGDEYYLLTGERSSDVYIWPNKYTVFPSGLVQPTDISTGNVVRDHLLDQYATEFFGLEDPTLSSHAVKSLNQLLNSEDASFSITGMGVGLVHGNFQFTGLLVIEYDDYIEFMQENSKQSPQHDEISLVKMSELDDIIKSFMDPFNITPTSAFSLANAITYVDKNMDIEHNVDIDIKQYVPEQPPRFDPDSENSIDFGKEW